MYNNKIQKYYSQIAEIYKKYQPAIIALEEEIDNAILSVISDEDKKDDTLSIPRFFSTMYWVQTYVNTPTKGGKCDFDDEESEYYHLKVDGVNFTECVGHDPTISDDTYTATSEDTYYDDNYDEEVE